LRITSKAFHNISDVSDITEVKVGFEINSGHDTIDELQNERFSFYLVLLFTGIFNTYGAFYGLAFTKQNYVLLSS